MWRDGRVWLIAAVLKTADLVMSGVRGFKSLSRRQKETVDALRYLKLQPRIECETYCTYDAGVPIPVLVFNALSE